MKDKRDCSKDGKKPLKSTLAYDFNLTDFDTQLEPKLINDDNKNKDALSLEARKRFERLELNGKLTEVQAKNDPTKTIKIKADLPNGHQGSLDQMYRGTWTC